MLSGGQILHCTPTADAHRPTVFQSVALGGLIGQLTFKMLTCASLGHPGDSAHRTLRHPYPLSRQFNIECHSTL